MKTKLFTLFLVICLIITVSPFQSFAAYDNLQSVNGAVNSAEPSAEGELPSKFDLRDRGVVTPVKLQSPWGDCWAHSAIAAVETSILTAMGSTYEETGLDLSERHLAWYVTRPVTENISKSQVGEGLYVYNTDAGANHVYDFGGREQCAATLFAQGIGPVGEQDYPYQGAEGRLALDDLLANKEAFIQQCILVYKDAYWYYSDEELRKMAEADYKSSLAKYGKYDTYSPLDDWSINEPDEPGSGKLMGSPYTLTDNNVFSYWSRLDDLNEADFNEIYGKEPLYDDGAYFLYQDSIDLIKAELYAGRGVSVGLSISKDNINYDTWAVYHQVHILGSNHVACIVGWDDNYAASNFTLMEERWDQEKEEYINKEITPPGNGAWIVKNSWGSETDLIPGGLTAADGTTRDANGGEWGIVDSQGKHTGYFYLSYYDASIIVPESFEFKIKANNDQENALQLDYLPASVTEWSHIDEKSMWEANIFTLDKDMRIDEVATRIMMSEKAPLTGFTCKFDLYKLYEGATKPDDGELISTATRTFENQGYHRTALDAPVYLKAGDRLGIMVQQSHTFDNGITRYCVDAQETDGYRTIHQDPVYGKPVLNEGESFWKCDGVTDQEEASREGWLDMTAPLSREMLLYLKPDLEDNSNMLDFYIRRFGGNPICDFFNIDNFCIKAFGEPCTLEHVDAVEPTAEDVGCIEHWLDPQTGQAYANEGGTVPLYLVTVTGGKADKKMAVAEDMVTITADTSDNSTFRYWELTDGTTDLEDSKALETSFKMPAENVTISAVFQKNISGGSGSGTVSIKYNIAAPENLSNGSFESSVNKAKKGEQVTVTVTPDEGYQAASVAVKDAKGNDVNVTDNGDGTYSFTMPGSAVTVTPTFTEIQKPDDPGEPDDPSEPGDDVCPRDNTCPMTPFTDTDKNEWYHDGVHWALEKAVMNGMSKTTFEPLTATTRAMIVTMLWRMEGSPQSDGSVTFKDVSYNMWFTDAIRWAATNDIVTGYDESTFGTNDSVTREQLATILYRYAQSKGKGFTGTWAFPLNFDDADQVSEWADEAMHWIIMNGVIQGMSEKELSPQGDAVRAQVATMLMRFSETLQA